jgi:hypothetical protein
MRGGARHAIATLGSLLLAARAWPTATARRLVPEPRSRGMRYAARLLFAIALAFAPPAAFSAQARDSFDHLTTGFELIGQHRDLPCESCHANAVFKGTPRDCASCHGVGTAIRATAKTATHMLSTQHCEGCHTPVAWRPAVNFDHAEAQGSCSTCHNNVQAQGKSPRHIDTDLECDVCHSSLSWAGAVFSHSGITSGCAACHNRVKANGVPATHIPTNGAPCEDCHSSTNFTTFTGTPMNTASILGTLQMPWRWSLSVDAERRNSPVLTTRNALIGQSATTLAQLEQVFTVQEIFQLAHDRTPISKDYSITATRPLGERFQFSMTVSATETAETPGSGGVDPQPATGLELTYQAQIYSSSLWTAGDFNVLTASYSNTEIGKLVGVSATSRFPLNSAWRVGPRLTVDRRNLVSDNSQELTYIPSVLVDYQRARKLLQFEVGGQLGKRDATLQFQNTKRYYVSLSYRMSF